MKKLMKMAIAFQITLLSGLFLALQMSWNQPVQAKSMKLNQAVLVAQIDLQEVQKMIKQNPQLLQQAQQLLQQNPELVQQLIQETLQQNPELIQQIQQNPQLLKQVAEQGQGLMQLLQDNPQLMQSLQQSIQSPKKP